MTEIPGDGEFPHAAQRYSPQLIVPPGWVWIPLEGNRPATVRRLFQDAWEGVPRDSIGPFIHRLEQVMLDMLDEASAAGGIAVVMPLGVPWQVPVSASIALSLVDSSGGETALPAGEEIVTDAGPAVRHTIDVDASQATNLEDLTVLRVIETTWRTPDGGAYLLASATVSGIAIEEYQPVTDALTTLITTMLDAMTWRAKEDAE